MNSFRLNGGPIGRRMSVLGGALGLTLLAGLGPVRVGTADSPTIKIGVELPRRAA